MAMSEGRSMEKAQQRLRFFILWERLKSRKLHIIGIRMQISQDGRIRLPAILRKVLEIQPGDEMVMRLENGSIRMIPLRQAVTVAQKAVRKYLPK